MRKELREALERFWRWMGEGHSDAQAAVRLLEAIERLGGLESALADDPTDHAPDLAAVVAAQGVALEALGQQVRDLAEQVHRLEVDLCAVEAALMDEQKARTADDPGPGAGGPLAPHRAPVVPEWAGMDDFGGTDYPELPLEPSPLPARTGGDGWLVQPVPVTISAFPAALTPHVSMVQWANDPFETWWCAMWPVRDMLPPVQVEGGERVGVRPDGRLEVVP